MRAITFRVEGRVQGVGFRAFAQRSAASLGICGWVENTPDGAVSGHAQGTDEALRAFQRDLGEGSRWSTVESLHAEPAATREIAGFLVRR
ncbi:MAG: acylphosphatase [Deltaproteobacteria bacterium]|nr:acylphosphatase [Deltaproteobacteria bacterium]